MVTTMQSQILQMANPDKRADSRKGQFFLLDIKSVFRFSHINAMGVLEKIIINIIGSQGLVLGSASLILC